MSYNKEKALQILEKMIEDETNPNVVCGLQDLQYALNLGLICYTQHLSHWSDIPEHSNQDTKEYFAALHNVHEKLTQAGIFSSSVLTG